VLVYLFYLFLFFSGWHVRVAVNVGIHRYTSTLKHSVCFVHLFVFLVYVFFQTLDFSYRYCYSFISCELHVLTVLWLFLSFFSYKMDSMACKYCRCSRVLALAVEPSSEFVAFVFEQIE